MLSNRSTLPIVLLALVWPGCSMKLDDEVRVIRPIYNLADSEIPMPNDLVRDADLGRLDIPLDDEDLTAAKRDFYTQLNTLDGWPTTFQIKLEFSGPVSEDTLDPATVQIWRWGDTPSREHDFKLSLQRAGTRLVVDPPPEGWLGGTEYVVMVRGGEDGMRGRLNEAVVADPSFYYVRMDEKLDEFDNERAFPGDTREERMEKAADLEEVRLEIKPYLDFFDGIGYPREEVVVLWTFTVTDHAELVIDRASQRIPIPFDLLIDPATGLVDLPIHEDDSELRKNVKRQVNGLDGFALSANMTFEFTKALDPTSVTPRDIKLYEMGGLPREVEVDAWLLPDGIHVVVEPLESPLKEQTEYALVIYDGLRDLDGKSVITSPIGMFLRSDEAIFAQGRSQNDAVPDLDAERIERVRAAVSPLFEQVGRDHVVTGWTFTTQKVIEPLTAKLDEAAAVAVNPNPQILEVKSPGEAMLDFLIGIASLADVEEVYYGTIQSPVYLDKVSRAFREDGRYEIEDVNFVMTIPSGHDPAEPLPVVIFGHAIMTESRFVLALGSWLAAEGFAVISIDFPYHGKRTHCKRGGPISVPHPLTGELIDLNPCADGTTCAADGRCVDPHGQGNALAQWPIIGFPMSSGAAFLEMDELAATKDHFTQSLIDLRALVHALKAGDWRGAIGYDLKTDELGFIGQSLGGIIGASFTSITPEITRAVWNVPGCDLVDMFSDSGYFGMQVDAFLKREAINRSSYDSELFFTVARWIMDGIDPASLAHIKAADDRKFLIQMATLDFIIPNWTTIKLGELANVPRRDYIAEHAFLCIPVEPAYFSGASDAAAFIAGNDNP